MRVETGGMTRSAAMLRDLAIVIGAFAAATGLAAAFGAANFGTALAFGQIGFAVALV